MVAWPPLMPNAGLVQKEYIEIMNGNITIELKEIVLRGFHGLYEEEKKIGNEFEINLSVVTKPTGGTITGLSETVNYAALYELLRSEMKKPRELLETFVMEFAELIHQQFRGIYKISISITKLHPPILQFQGKVSVSYSREY